MKLLINFNYVCINIEKYWIKCQKILRGLSLKILKDAKVIIEDIIAKDKQSEKHLKLGSKRIQQSKQGRKIGASIEQIGLDRQIDIDD